MKKLFAPTLALASLALSAFASDPASTTLGKMMPTYGYTTLVSTATNAPSTATNVAATIDCRYQKSVAVAIHQQNDDTGTDVIGYFFQFSVDGSNWDGVGKYVTVAAAGSTAVNIVTNLNTWGCGYMKLAYITNAAATAGCTNLLVRYANQSNTP